jgi:hypothetical protein
METEGQVPQEYVDKYNKEKELKKLQEAWSEALHRLPDNSARDLISLTTEAKTSDEVQKYLEKHQSTLTPEEIFFLRCSIEIKKLKQSMSW